MPVPRFSVELGERWGPLWTLASVAAHVVLIVVLVVATSIPRERTTMILLQAPGALGPREFILPALEGGSGGSGGSGGKSGSAVAVAPDSVPDSIPSEPEAEPIAVEGPSESDEEGAPIRTRRLLGPAYGDGRLWVRGFEAELGVVGPSDDVTTHVARVDSAIRARLKAFIDTMPRDSFAVPQPPSWTIETDDLTWGIDPQWIYLGSIKLPTALLALLPFPEGNYYQAQEARELQEMREDILRAARRAETAENFRTYVEEVRKRKDAEREAKRKVKRDTIIP